MDWANAALLSAAIIGLVNILDSHLLSRRMPGLRAFLLPVSLVYVIYSTALFWLFPLPPGLAAPVLLAAVASALFRSAAVLLLLYTLIKQEVSRVIPVVHTYPVFVALMAVPLLGERLQPLQWLAIIIVVAGAVLISLRQNLGGALPGWGRPLLMLIGSSLLMALGDITSKYTLSYLSSWQLFWLSSYCIAGVFLAVSLRPRVLRQLGGVRPRRPVFSLLLGNELLALTGMMLSLWAIQRGPVSLVSPIIGSRPIFVVIFALILSRASPAFVAWQPGRGQLALRLAATAMIVAGIAIISLSRVP
ncbi:MAG: EamA family transporter [Chloroflexota bacterium]